MQKLILIVSFLLLNNSLFAQESAWSWYNDALKKAQDDKKKKETSTEPKDRLVRYEVINGDTIVIIDLPDVVVMDQVYKKKYDRDLYYVKRMYPYAKLIAQIKKENDSILSDLNKRRDKKEYIESRKELVFAQFDDAVRKMSVNEGKYLVKMIHRECGATAYDVISDYLGEVKTFMWQAASRLGGADLKLKYDSKGDDKIMEDVLQKIDQGEIKVRKLKIDENAVENKMKEKVEAKKKKKEARKAK